MKQSKFSETQIVNILKEAEAGISPVLCAFFRPVSPN